jgi:putative NIF3 family GTP cyclohydrolase 1 type 2
MTTVRELETLLFAAFPAAHATPDDRIGLLAGDPEVEVGGIALALDAKVSTIEAAAAEGCNVLVSHHPVFWYPPTEFLRTGSSEGAAIYRAAELGVALIAMHTNLDCAPVAREMLLEPVGFCYCAPLSLPSELDSQLRAPGSNVPDPRALAVGAEPVAALGQLGTPKPDDGEAVSLRELASRYRTAFGAVAKVWGSPEKPVKLLATCSGAGGSLVQRVISLGADCYVTGEVAYHEALELAAAGVALIELGHDRSELPYRFTLRDALAAGGFEPSALHVLDPTTVWWQ